MARCTSAAATAESTPPESPQMARPSPTCRRMASIAVSTIEDVVQSCRAPHASTRKRSNSRWPPSVWATSGWNCTP